MGVHIRASFFSREIGFRLKYFVIASESNGYRPGRACVAAHRTGIWACQGHDPLFLWLRWVEVSPKRFSLHARYSFYPSKYAASPQVAKACVPLFLFSRRMQGDTDMAGCDDSKAESSQVMNRQLSTLTRISIHATAAANHAEFSFPDCTGRNRRSESAVSRTFFV